MTLLWNVPIRQHRQIGVFMTRFLKDIFGYLNSGLCFPINGNDLIDLKRSYSQANREYTCPLNWGPLSLTHTCGIPNLTKFFFMAFMNAVGDVFLNKSIAIKSL